MTNNEKPVTDMPEHLHIEGASVGGTDRYAGYRCCFPGTEIYQRLDIAEARLQAETELADRLADALGIVMRYAGAEEGQRWSFRFNTDEGLYSEWDQALNRYREARK